MEGDEADLGVIAAAKAGDKDAWELLFRRVYPRLRAFLARQLGSEHVEDAVNETMARAVAGIGRFNPELAGFEGWVFGIGRHVSAEFRRQQRRAERLRPAEVIQGVPHGGIPQPEESMLDDEQHRFVRAAFDALRPAEREVLELRVIAQLNVEEVATALGKRPGAVRTMQSRALAHLREQLRRHEH